MKKILFNSLIIVSLLVMIFQSNLFAFQVQAANKPDANTDDLLDPGADNSGDPGGNGSVSSQPKLDAVQKAADGLVDYAFDSSNTLTPMTADSQLLSQITNLAPNKLLLNPSDAQDLRILECLGNAIPDYANNLDSLAATTGRTYADILNLKTNSPADFETLVQTTQETARTNLVANLKNDVANFSCIAGLSTTAGAEMLANDPASAEAIISYAQDKIVIDRRVLELLVNLVTPKNEGGSGHERIKVYRLRRNYERDARMFSRESIETYDKISQDTKKQDSQNMTLDQIDSASQDQLATSSDFSGAEAQAAVIDTSGHATAELVFSDSETAQNISAHYKGEAVDISEMDYIRCTKIEKKRIGSDKKTPLPPTPIRLVWQTTDGYGKNQPASYSSLNANFNKLASGELLDLLDEFGINSDSTMNLSNASFGDITNLIGKSLLGEILGTDGQVLSGAGIPDTLQKVGAEILASRLGLPTATFTTANLNNLDDLKTQIGESFIEQNLNLPFGSISGNNIGQVFTNIGLRKLEDELAIPAGTLSPTLDAAGIKLAIGRSVINDKLNLPDGTFQSDSTLTKLDDKVGERKVNLLFSTPGEIDDTLKLDLGTTNNYKNGAMSPDSLAMQVGAKVLLDNAYIFNFSSASGSALGLGLNWADGKPNSNVAASRFVAIMSGGDQTVNYQNLGIETLASALTSNNDTRAALLAWLNSSQTRSDCTLPNSLTANVGGKTVAIPEDQIMSATGINRGDFFRLFGCQSVNPTGILNRLGETDLYNGIQNSDLATQAQNNFLTTNPGLTTLPQSADFYQGRLDAIKDTTSKIANNWNNLSGDDAKAMKNLLTDITNRLLPVTSKKLTVPEDAVVATRQVPVSADQILKLISDKKNSSDSATKSAANNSLTIAQTLVKNINEIISGQIQPNLGSLKISDVSASGTNLTTNSSYDGSGIDKGPLLLMLAGKLSPNDFVLSAGAGQIESALDLPSNSLLYYSKHSEGKNSDKNDEKAAFYRAVGQAGVEETFNMPAYFFQGDTPAAGGTLTDIKSHVAKSYNISDSEAGAQIMKALGLTGDFSAIENANVSAVSNIAAASKQIDDKMDLKSGTTEALFTATNFGDEQIDPTDGQLLAANLDLPESAINTFEAVKNGKIDLKSAKDNIFASNISYNSHNPFVPSAENPGNTASCPAGFSYQSSGSSTVSISNQIEDNAYLYVDKTGIHSFQSFADAKTYANNNSDKKVDFVTAIADGLAKTNGLSAADNASKLNDFLTDKKSAQAVPDANLAKSSEVPSDTISQLLTRAGIKNKPRSGNSYSGFLETAGQRIANGRINSLLLGAGGISVAGLSLGASDVFDLLSGNSQGLAKKIGSRYVEQQFNVGENLVTKLVEAPTATLKNCSLADLGASLIGSALGLNNFSGSGNIYNNLGGSKIEGALGLPAGSFHGGNIDQLISSVGAANFAKAFNLPAENVIAPIFDSARSAIDAKSIKNLPASDQYEQAIEIADNPAMMSASKYQTTNDILDKSVGAYSDKLKTDQSVWQPGTITSVSDYQKSHFQNRATEIDAELGLPAGSTQNLLSGKTSPDQFRNSVSAKVVGDLAGTDLSNALGIDAAYGLNAANLYKQIIGCRNSAKTCDKGAIFNSFEGIFGIDLDSKLSLPAGTFAGLIDNPKLTKTVLLQTALGKLDQSLGLDSGSLASFYNLYQLAFNDGYKNCDGDPTGCLKNGTLGEGAWNFLGVLDSGSQLHKSSGEKIVWTDGTNTANNWINGSGILPQPGVAGNLATFKEIASDFKQMLSGDTRMLQVAAAVKAAESLHIYNGSQTVNLPGQYRISYDDIKTALFGGVDYENAYATISAKNYLANITKSPDQTLANPTEISEMATQTGNYIYGSQCPPGTSATDCADNPAFAYSTTDKLSSLQTSFASQNSYDATLNDQKVFDGKVAALNDDQQLDLAATQESARNEARGTMLKNLTYRMADAKLYAADPNIPAGFVQTMMSGSGLQKTMMLTSYIKNGLANGKLFGIELGIKLDPNLISAIKTVKGFWENPAGTNLDNLLKSGALDQLGQWIGSNAGNFFGFQFQPGTIAALAKGLKTGDYLGDYKYTMTTNGQTVTKTVAGLKTIYTDWAIGKISTFGDQALGLPPGTSYTAYNMYRQLNSARDALAAANASGDAAKISSAQANVAAMKAEVISFVVNTVFSEQIGQLENKLGLVPGTGALLVSMGVSLLMGAAINPAVLVLFVAMNLFGVYKVEVKCTADGYYPEIQSPPDSSVYDNGGTGVFDGMNSNSMRDGYIRAAQYKARTLIANALDLSDKSGDDLAIPSQILTGRQVDVDYWNSKINDVICSKIGGSCVGTNAGAWTDSQTTAYTHIGF
ncbi:MAG: hypothetical protein NTW79_02085 [Candidatus Berkelbacteria bacterium]|nr:hypothetical protein [Candidatus Berkelbacteria bacterium]